jgi:transposase-like protein
MKRYGTASYQENKRKRRPVEERNRIAREVVSGKLSIEEVQLKYQIACRDTVLLWLRQYKKAQQELPDLLSQEVKTAALSSVEEVSPEELRLARLKIRALETMLDIASEAFKTDIRKKFGAKR